MPCPKFGPSPTLWAFMPLECRIHLYIWRNELHEGNPKALSYGLSSPASTDVYDLLKLWKAIPRETPVLIVGGGPSGLILALQLARHGIRCTLVERNQSTTKWPKMDITNCRSMELFNRLGIAQGLREIGVPQKYSLDVLFSTGLSNGGELITKWGLPSPDEWRERIRSQNDGTMPREPYQRCSQSVFEAWLKPYIQAEPLIDSQFSVKFETLRELEDSVESYLTNVETGERYVTRSKFVVGCDGAGSSVRKAIGSELIGGPVPGAMLLVHFKSRDLNKLHRQGQFWHIYFTGGGVIISQDEVDTWTAHLPIPLDADPEEIDPDQAIYDVLGGSIGSCPIKIDKILIKSAWRPNICIATKYVSESRRIFLSGDAAHQNIPTGGYGMNTAVGDSFDIGWKLAAVLKGFCGKYILDSYEAERKPVALRNLDRSGVHFSVHTTYWNWALEAGPGVVASSADKGQQLRMKIRNHVLALDGENKDHGIEMGYRYNESPIIVPDDEETEPEWRVREYVTSTWPGVRAPHVYLADGKTSIFDLFGGDYTIVDFTEEGFISQDFMSSAATLNIPITRVHLPSEIHVRDVWGRRAVLIRPDDHVAWRAPLNPIAPIDVTRVLKVACGQLSSRDDISQSHVLKVAPEEGFSGTIGNQDQNTVQMLAAFQK